MTFSCPTPSPAAPPTGRPRSRTERRAWALLLIAVLAGCAGGPAAQRTASSSAPQSSEPQDQTARAGAPAPSISEPSRSAPSRSAPSPPQVSAPPTSAPPSNPPSPEELAAARRVGAEIHPRILARYGGALDDPRAAAYVSTIGRRLIDASALRASDRWTFTILDTGEVNAFASPGGYVYVTRGLLTLANKEDDVAAVLGHELGHIESRHAEQRLELMRRVGEIRTEAEAQARSEGVDLEDLERDFRQISQVFLARFTQDQELEADSDGIEIAALAGYEPIGQARMLERMQAQSEIEARAVGAAAASRRMRFLSTHPATPERLERARRIAAETPTGPRVRRADAHLDAVDGLIFGDDESQGFVRGRDFVHPELGFRFKAPPGYRLSNSAREVVARHPQGRVIVFDGRPKNGMSLSEFIRGPWSAELRARFAGLGALSPIERGSNQDFQSRRAAAPVQVEGGVGRVQIVAFDAGDTIYRLTALSSDRQAATAAAELEVMSRSFRRLTDGEPTGARPDRLRVVTVRPGDTVDTLAARLPYARLKTERFRVLNGLGLLDRVRPGMRVKLIERF
ncbi:MAG: M48 family metalloprotease [Pseudomonadota bacterium]